MSLQILLKKLEDQQKGIKDLKDKLDNLDTDYNNLINQIETQNSNVESIKITLQEQFYSYDGIFIFGVIFLCLYLLLILVFFPLIKFIYGKIPKNKKEKLLKNNIINTATRFNNYALLITGVVMVVSTFIVFGEHKDTTFFTVYTVVASVLISVGLTMSVYSEQLIEDPRKNKELLKEIHRIVRGKKIRENDLVPLRGIQNQMDSIIKDLNKKKISEHEALERYKQQKTALNNILKNYED